MPNNALGAKSPHPHKGMMVNHIKQNIETSNKCNEKLKTH